MSTVTWYQPRTAVALLRERHWVKTTVRDLLACMEAAGIVRRTTGGYQLIDPSAHRGLLRNHYRQGGGVTESGQFITRHTVAIRFTDAGIDWIAATLNLEKAA